MSDTVARSSRTRAEIASQPTCWTEALRRADAGVVGLPQEGESILALGCGTSYYVGSAYATLREAAGHGVSDALIASDLPTRLRAYDRVVAVSRSGTSSELIDAVTRIRTESPGTRVTVLLGEQDTPIADLADDVVDLSFADESSVVQTRFPTTQLVLLRASLDGLTPDLLALPDRARVALARDLPASDVRQIVFLASGWGAAMAQEAALKVREASGSWVESYPVPEYRHGPVATCGPGSLIWGFDRLPDDIVATVEAAGGVVEHGGGEPLVELVRAHRFALERADLAGRDADTPYLLSRSVIR